MKRRRVFHFVLYVAGDGPNSALALANLNALCRGVLKDSHTIDVIDVFRDPQRAINDRVFMTPTLVKVSPSPTRTIVGNLSDREPLLRALGLAVDTQ